MNGLVERQNQGILRTLRIAKAINVDWRKAIKDYVYAYNTTPHSVTGKAPMELMTGRPVKDLLPSLRTEPNLRRDEDVRERDAIKKMQGKAYADQRRHARSSEIDVGDEVMLRNYETGKLEPKFKLDKFKVVKKNGSDVIVRNEEGVMYRRPASHLKKWPTGNVIEPLQSASSDEQSTDQSEIPVAVPVSRDRSSTKSKSRHLSGREPSPSMMNSKIQDEDDESCTTKRPKRDKKLPARYSS
nr:uncharacterized protein LOC115266973 [Aedes albopictus]